MKTHTTYILAGLFAAAPLCTAQETTAQPAVTTPEAGITWEEAKQGMSYMLGLQLGGSLKYDLQCIQASDIDSAVLYTGVTDGLQNKVAPEMQQKDLPKCIEVIVKEMERRMAAEETGKALAPIPQNTNGSLPSWAEAKTVFSYLIGQQLGSSLAQTPDLTELKGEDLDQSMLQKGIADAIAESIDPQMQQKDAQAIASVFVDEMLRRQQAKAAVNKAEGEAFLAENAKKEGVTTTASGLQYKVLTQGTGRTYNEKTDTPAAIAEVIYEGRKIDGTIFDAQSTPIEFPLNGVVPGFSEALKLMPIGSEWEIYIPSDLAYGANGPGVIGPNATLIFKMKLVGLKAPLGSMLNPIQTTPEEMQKIIESAQPEQK